MGVNNCDNVGCSIYSLTELGAGLILFGAAVRSEPFVEETRLI